MTTSPTASKVILITDAGSEVGEALARHLAAQGHALMLGARSIERAARLARDLVQAGGAATYQELDSTSRGSVRAFLVIAEAWHGRIDVLVNTSGLPAGIAAVLPFVQAQGVHVIHVPTDHALQAAAIAATISDALDRRSPPPSAIDSSAAPSRRVG